MGVPSIATIVNREDPSQLRKGQKGTIASPLEPSAPSTSGPTILNFRMAYVSVGSTMCAGSNCRELRIGEVVEIAGNDFRKNFIDKEEVKVGNSHDRLGWN